MPRPIRPISKSTELIDITDDDGADSHLAAMSFPELAKRWLAVRWALDKLARSESDLKQVVARRVEREGHTDDKGHIWVDLPANVVGSDSKTYRALQRQRRVSVSMDQDAALDVLRKRGLLATCSQSYVGVTDIDKAYKLLAEHGLIDSEGTAYTVPDEEGIRGAYFEGKIDEEDYARIFVQRVTWATIPVAI